MTTLLIIIGVLLIAFQCLIIYLLRQPIAPEIDDENNRYWSNDDMLDFAQSVTNIEVTEYDFDVWVQMNAKCGDCGNKLTLVRPVVINATMPTVQQK